MTAVFDFAHRHYYLSASVWRAVRHAAWMAVLVLAVACGQGAPAGAPAGGAAGGGRGPAMAMPVDIITLAPKPVEQLGEFVGTVKSRRSTTIQPQVEGIITDIPVKSGDRVTPGTPLVHIDSTSQQAAAASLQSLRAARDADATWARQQAQRAKSLLDAGAGSRQEYEQAQAQQKAAEAQLKAIDDQIRQQQAELAYYRVVAPTAGVIGDIPVRVGDRVTKATRLTTIDDNSGLEVYVNVPVQQATGLHIGESVRIVNEVGAVVAEERVSFISGSVDDETQTVLVKAPLESTTTAFRTDQFVRVRLVFSTVPGLTVPVVSVVRINGQYFAFVAEAGKDGGLVAHQRAVTLGPVVGNEYLVVSGLKAGDRLIVGGLQKIGDGAPVQVLPSRGAAPPPAGRGGH
jgi:RND family efflux transporter MFP subunit